MVGSCWLTLAGGGYGRVYTAETSVSADDDLVLCLGWVVLVVTVGVVGVGLYRCHY